VVVVHSVEYHYRSQRTGSKTVHVLNRELAIISGASRCDTELPEHLVGQKFSSSHVTRGAHANGECILATRCKRKSFVETCHTIYFHEGNPEFLSHYFHRLFRDISIGFLHVLEYFNELMWLAAAALQYRPE
jgi:hypothetical protein